MSSESNPDPGMVTMNSVLASLQPLGGSSSCRRLLHQSWPCRDHGLQDLLCSRGCSSNASAPAQTCFSLAPARPILKSTDAEQLHASAFAPRCLASFQLIQNPFRMLCGLLGLRPSETERGQVSFFMTFAVTFISFDTRQALLELLPPHLRAVRGWSSGLFSLGMT